MWLSRISDTISNYLLPFSMSQRIDFLGLLYASSPETNVTEAFWEDFNTRIWLTYRSGFESLTDRGGTRVNLCSDSGWGCSIRATQMLLAQSLMSGLLGRDWRRKNSNFFDEILSLFFDSFSAPLSIHRMVQLGDTRFGKRPGAWFGPTTGAKAITQLFNETEFSRDKKIFAITFDSGEIITSKVDSIFQNGGQLIMFLSYRLGLESFNAERYKRTLQILFAHPFFQGISSGESVASAYYFFAASDQYLFYMDPHTVQPALLSVPELTSPPRILKMHWSRLNPSLCLGFFLKSKIDFDLLTKTLIDLDPDLFEIREHSYEDTATEKIEDMSFQVI